MITARPISLSHNDAVKSYCGWLRPTTAASGSAFWAIEWWNHTQAQKALPSLHWRPSLSLATLLTASLRLKRAGFSLIEIMIALGITVTLVSALLGLMPLALDQLHHSATMTAEARIVQSVHAQYQMLSWAEILQQQRSQGVLVFHFDGQGVPVDPRDDASIYTARVTVKEAAPLPGTTTINDHMRQLIILVSDKPGAGDAVSDVALATQHQTLIAQTDKQL